MKVKTLLALGLAALVTSGFAWTQGGYGNRPDDEAEREAEKQVDEAAQIALQRPSYPLETCAVSGEGLHDMGGPIDVLHEGKLVRLCCKGCKKALAKKGEEIVEKIDAAVVAAQKEGYPLERCVVSGEPLEEPVDLVHGTRLVRLCCKGCKKAFLRKPEKAMAKIDAALIERQKKSYPLQTCLVSGEPLEGKPVDVLHGVQLVRFCCKGCVKPFEKDPDKLIAKLDQAKKQ